MPVSDQSRHTLLRSNVFDQFEELSGSVIGWELDFCQLSKSDSPFYLEQIAGSSVFVSRAYLPSSFYQRGSCAPGYRTVSILAFGSGPSSWRWCYENVTHDSMLVMPKGGEFESVSGPEFDSIHISLSIPLLERVAETQFGVSLRELMPDDRCFCPQGGVHLSSLRRILQQLTTGPQSATAQLKLTPTLEVEMASVVLKCLDAGRARCPQGPRSKRMHTLARALDIIAAQDTARLNIGNLVEQLGVSRRTLENAFCDGLGISPAAFLKAMRLQRLNRALLSADDESVRISELARSNGFNHLGQLASDYRAMFGELPSVTLGRGPRSAC